VGTLNMTDLVPVFVSISHEINQDIQEPFSTDIAFYASEKTQTTDVFHIQDCLGSPN
jgi:hypothetical protein